MLLMRKYFKIKKWNSNKVCINKLNFDVNISQNRLLQFEQTIEEMFNLEFPNLVMAMLKTGVEDGVKTIDLDIIIFIWNGGLPY